MNPTALLPLAVAIALGLALAALSPARAEEGDRLDVYAGAGYLGAPGASGAAMCTGLRLRLSDHFAGTLDLGYGLLGAPSSFQDRWWVTPGLALELPIGRVRIELGAGGGVGTSSGYRSWADYSAEPFGPTWHYTVPAARAHVSATTAISPSFDVFARADAVMLFAGPQAALADTLWGGLWLGVQSPLL